MKIDIKAARKQDLIILNSKLPVNTPNFHKNQLKEQEAGDNLYLIAWKGNEPIGHLLVRFGGTKKKKVKQYLKKCPHLEAMGVKEEFRRKEVATQLVQEAEKLIKEKNLEIVGLAVENDPKSAPHRLYKKLRYKDWGHGEVIESWEFIDEKGKKKTKHEKCIYLIKKLKKRG